MIEEILQLPGPDLAGHRVNVQKEIIRMTTPPAS